ncbi:MAG TPA: hypothetical protein VGH81_05325 [Rudaea sp.]|jgi:hypothetical protein
MKAEAFGSGSKLPQRRFALCAFAIVLLALVIRVLYVWMTTVEFPIRGDVNQYVLYAWNLTHRSVFSTALPDADSAPPDDYRGPGYPMFLAGAMILAGHSDLPLRSGPEGRSALGYVTDTWMKIALGFQIVLGTATVWFVIALGRFWLADGWALAAGLLTALWPHLVTFTGVLLSETLFALLLLLALWLSCLAYEARSRIFMAAAGAVWGVAYLVNPLIALFPLVAAALILRGRGRRLAATLVAAFLLAPAVWTIRNAVSVRDSGTLHRAEENFVQGSWPEFLTAFNSQRDNDISRRIVDAVNTEAQQLKGSFAAGLVEIEARMAQDPRYYAAWYVARKPYLLWDWSIRVGAGDIYFLPVQHSPFEKIPVLSTVRAALRWANPLIFALAAACSFTILGLSLLRRKGSAPALLAGLLLLYLTSVHVVLQAEPRYSIPYRPEEILLALTAAAWLSERLRNALRQPRSGASTHF